MPNTIDPLLVTKQLKQNAIDLLPALLAPLSDYSTLVPLAGPAANCEVPLITGLPALKIAASDFESDTDSSVSNVTQAPAHIAQVVKISSGDAQNGTLIDYLLRSALNALATEIQRRAVALFTHANFSNTFSTTAAVGFGTGDLTAARVAVPSPHRCLLLDSTAYSGIADRLQSVGGKWALPGFQSVNEIPTFASGVIGACVDPSAISVLIGPALLPAGGRPEAQTITIPGLGVSVTAAFWGNPDLRTGFASYECRFAGAVAQAGSASLAIPT